MSRPMTSADLVIVALTDAERDLLAELHAVREALHAGLDVIHRLTRENQRQADHIEHLIEEIRKLRPAPSKRRAA